MSLSMQKMNLFAENLANSQTTGYKKKTYTVHSFQDMLVELPDVTNSERYHDKMPIATGSYIDGAAVKQDQGTLRQTGNNLNLAIMGEKVYFQTETNKPAQAQPGQPALPTSYTISRDGNFMTDVNNYLINGAGDYVLDTNNQRIRLTADKTLATQPPDPNKRVPSLAADRIRIDQFGRIFDSEDKTKDAQGNPVPRASIKLVQWTANAAQPQPKPGDPEVDATEMQRILKKYGFAMPDDHTIQGQGMQAIQAKAEYDRIIEQQGPRKGLPRALGPNDLAPLNVNIKQGYLEASNVDITSEMVNLMMTSKDYDMSQKLIGAEDKVLDKTINEMGRLQ